MSRDDRLAIPNKRYVATIIDGLIIFLLNLPVMYLITLFDDQEALTTLLLIFLYQAVVYSIFDLLIPICTKGQTIGRMLLKLRIVKQDYTEAKPINFIRRASIFVLLAFTSEVLLFVNVTYILWAIIFLLSIYWIYNDPLRRTVHDRFADTIVINDSLK